MILKWINCHTGNRLALVILGLITENLIMRTIALLGPGTIYLLYPLS